MSNELNEVSLNRPIFAHRQHHQHQSSNKPNSLKHKYMAQQASELTVLEPRPPSFSKPKRDGSATLHANGPRRNRYAAKTSSSPSPVPFHSEHSDVESMDTTDYPMSRTRSEAHNEEAPVRASSHGGHDEQPEYRRSRSKSKNRRDQEEVIQLLNRTTITNRPLSSRLSKYTEPLPQIGHKFKPKKQSNDSLTTNHSPDMSNKRSVSSSSILLSTSTFNDVDDDAMEDETALLNRSLLIGVRLPNGKRIQTQLASNTKLLRLVQLSVEELRVEEPSADAEPNSYALLQMPNLLYQDLQHSLDSFNIEDKTMFFLINKENL